MHFQNQPQEIVGVKKQNYHGKDLLDKNNLPVIQEVKLKAYDVEDQSKIATFLAAIIIAQDVDKYKQNEIWGEGNQPKNTVSNLIQAYQDKKEHATRAARGQAIPPQVNRVEESIVDYSGYLDQDIIAVLQTKLSDENRASCLDEAKVKMNKIAEHFDSEGLQWRGNSSDQKAVAWYNSGVLEVNQYITAYNIYFDLQQLKTSGSNTEQNKNTFKEQCNKRLWDIKPRHTISGELLDQIWNTPITKQGSWNKIFELIANFFLSAVGKEPYKTDQHRLVDAERDEIINTVVMNITLSGQSKSK